MQDDARGRSNCGWSWRKSNDTVSPEVQVIVGREAKKDDGRAGSHEADAVSSLGW